MTKRDHLTELHNKAAGKITRLIVKPTIQAGGQATDVMVLLESVVMGVAMVCLTPGQEAPYLDLMVERVKKRIAEIHALRTSPPAGSA